MIGSREQGCQWESRRQAPELLNHARQRSPTVSEQAAKGPQQAADEPRGETLLAFSVFPFEISCMLGLVRDLVVVRLDGIPVAARAIWEAPSGGQRPSGASRSPTPSTVRRRPARRRDERVARMRAGAGRGRAIDAQGRTGVGRPEARPHSTRNRSNDLRHRFRVRVKRRPRGASHTKEIQSSLDG